MHYKAHKIIREILEFFKTHPELSVGNEQTFFIKLLTFAEGTPDQIKIASHFKLRPSEVPSRIERAKDTLSRTIHRHYKKAEVENKKLLETIKRLEQEKALLEIEVSEYQKERRERGLTTIPHATETLEGKITLRKQQWLQKHRP